MEMRGNRLQIADFKLNVSRPVCTLVWVLDRADCTLDNKRSFECS
jgi:hypothetical protein